MKRGERVAVGLLLPTLHFGGAERWSLDLASGCDPSRLHWTGCVVMHEQYTHPWMVESMSARMPVHVAGVTRSRFPARGQNCSEHLASASDRLLASADVVVTWEVDEQARALLDRLDTRVVQVAHRRDPESLGRYTRDSDHYVAVWRSCVDVFGKDLVPRVAVIPNGIDLNRAAPSGDPFALRASWGCSAETLVVGYLGRVDAGKNLEALIRAVDSLGGDCLGLVIGSLSPGGEKVAAQLGAHERVLRLPGTEDVGTALAAFDVFFLPSRSEVFSLSLLEAWAAKRPVVATRCGAVPDLERRLGPLVVPVDPEASGRELAAAVREAASNDPGLACMRERAAGLVWREFNLRRMGRDWTDFLARTKRSSGGRM